MGGRGAASRSYGVASGTISSGSYEIADWTDEDIIKSWSAGMAYDLRAVYQGSDDWSSDLSLEGMKALNERLDDFLHSQPKYSGEIYRGIQVDNPIVFTPGQVIDQMGAASWTTDKSMADRFTTPLYHGQAQRNAYVFVTRNKSGVDVDSMTLFGEGQKVHQSEVLVPSGVEYRVDKVEKPKKKGGITYVYVTEL